MHPEANPGVPRPFESRHIAPDADRRDERARRMLEATRLRDAAARAKAAQRIGRSRLAPRSPLEVRRAGKLTVKTKARGGRGGP